MTTPSEAAGAGTPLFNPRYPRANAYDPQWVFENQMGPHCLWLMEALTDVLPIESGMRVLDLGCGRAMTSIFLAKEFGAEVWATDLWIGAEANQARIDAAGLSDVVTPVHAEAHALPFEPGFFHAVVSVDAFHYFGTNDLYIGYITRFLRDGGRIGVVAPGCLTEFGANVPVELAPYWDWEFCSFHGPAWWRNHWEKTGRVTVDLADALEDGWRDWLQFDEATIDHLHGWRHDAAINSAAMLRADQGNHFCFSRMVATKKEPAAEGRTKDS
ncbi:MAG TPA: methyltransferase domain-containing protein [Acidimicrobiales bacterium]|nr:methyltransferase domain-containing protein [Acidimicrobiales bacterium]